MKHPLEFILNGSYHISRKKDHALLGGSTDHSVKTSTVFDVGYLSGVLLLPPDVRIGYNIMSACSLRIFFGQRRIQMVLSMCLLTIVALSAGRGRVGCDSIFYLDDDTNLLLLISTVVGGGEYSSVDALSDMSMLIAA
jgi:hypothetical protein